MLLCKICFSLESTVEPKTLIATDTQRRNGIHHLNSEFSSLVGDACEQVISHYLNKQAESQNLNLLHRLTKSFQNLMKKFGNFSQTLPASHVWSFYNSAASSAAQSRVTDPPEHWANTTFIYDYCSPANKKRSCSTLNTDWDECTCLPLCSWHCRKPASLTCISATMPKSICPLPCLFVFAYFSHIFRSSNKFVH